MHARTPKARPSAKAGSTKDLVSSSRKITNRLTALSSAAVLAIYSAGYFKTKAAAERFEETNAHRRSAASATSHPGGVVLAARAGIKAEANAGASRSTSPVPAAAGNAIAPASAAAAAVVLQPAAMTPGSAPGSGLSASATSALIAKAESAAALPVAASVEASAPEPSVSETAAQPAVATAAPAAAAAEAKPVEPAPPAVTH
ncbi:MAG: hypothetical protein ABI652_06320, partial [Acidobacteriota bacterium]